MEHRQDSIRRKILHFSNRTVDVVLDRVVPGAPNAEDWMFDEEVRELTKILSKRKNEKMSERVV